MLKRKLFCNNSFNVCFFGDIFLPANYKDTNFLFIQSIFEFLLYIDTVYNCMIEKK